jgi:glycosyltransferase involved in cell wall biosynthesis
MRTLLVVPTYNERTTLPPVVDGVLAVTDDVDMLVVDDASPDGTGAIADRLAAGSSRVQVLHRPAKSGLGTAYRAGFAWGLERGYDAFGEMDADLSHEPTALPGLLLALRGADVVIGSRYVPGGGVVDWPLPRVMLSRGGNRYVRWCTGMPVTDATSGYRLYRRPVLQALAIDSVRSEGYSFQVEMALRAWRSGFRVVEVPIVFTERREGASKISRVIVLEALLRVAQWGLSGARRPAGVHPASVAASGG